MQVGRTNVNKFLLEEQVSNPELGGEFAMLLSDVVRSCKAIAQGVARGALAGLEEGDEAADIAGTRRSLEAMAQRTVVDHCTWGGHLAAMSSAIGDDFLPIPGDGPQGRYLLAFDPLDGVPHVGLNLTLGSIFSILARPDGGGPPCAADFLQPGSAQIAAGYALYSSSTMLVLTVGNGTHGFTLDREIGEFLLTHPFMRIPKATQYFLVNASNERFWEPPIRRYVDECQAGASGVRGKDFTMRWAGMVVADVHRLLVDGGVFLYPRDTRDHRLSGRQPLLHKASPLAMLVEQAGGLASTGYQRIADVRPQSLRERVAVILGSRDEVERIDRYHQEYLNGDDQPFSSPLFRTRSLYRRD